MIQYVKPFVALILTIFCLIIMMNYMYSGSDLNSNTVDVEKETEKKLEDMSKQHTEEYKKLTEEIKILKALLIDKNKEDIKTIISEYSSALSPDIRRLFNDSMELNESLHGLKVQLERLNQHSVDGGGDVDGSSPPFKKYQMYRFIWFTTVRSNYINAPPPNDMGGAGYAAEAIDFIIPLCKKYPLFGWVEEVPAEDWKKSFLVQGLSVYERYLIEKCNERGQELLKMDDIPGIGVIQYLPYDFLKIKAIFKEHMSKMKYLIGRSMFETNNVPPAWQDLINGNVNELWVPTEFHVDVFTSHGITVPVVAIGEGFDPVKFNAITTSSNRALLFPDCKEDDYIFITASQYIDRKGFDHLFDAYVKAFTKDDKVCLAVRANGLKELTFDNPNELRRCKVERLSDESYTSFYKSGDVFVSASHGEGWGRTNQEAMAMGIPAILPLWGGITGYTTEDVVIPIKVDELEQAFPDKPPSWLLGKEKPNHKWAKVQVPRIRDAMRWAYDNQDAARAIGKRGEAYMKKNFTRRKIAEKVLKRTNQIYTEKIMKNE